MAEAFVDAATTMGEAMERCFEVFGDQPHIGTCQLGDMDDKGKWSWLSYRQIGHQSALLAAGLAGLVCGYISGYSYIAGIVYERGTMAYPTHPPQCDEAGAPALPRRSSIAIVAGNSARWLMVDFACALNDYMDVGVHADWGLDWVAYNQGPGSHTARTILGDADVACAFVGSETEFDLILAAKLTGEHYYVGPDGAVDLQPPPDTPAPLLHTIVLMAEEVEPKYFERAQKRASAVGLKVLTWATVMEIGERRRADFFMAAAQADSSYRHSPLTWTGFGFGFDPGWQTLASPMAEMAGGAAEEWRRLESLKDNDQLTFSLMFSSGTSGGTPKATSTSKHTWKQTNMGASFIRQRTVDDRVVVSYTPWVHGSDRGICWFSTFAGAQIALVPQGTEHTDDATAAVADPKPIPARAFSSLTDVDGYIAASNYRNILRTTRIMQPTFFLGMSYIWTDLWTLYRKRLLPHLDKHLLSMLGSVPGCDDVKLEQCLAHSEAWDACRNAFLATREGGAINRALLDEVRIAMGGKLFKAVTGGSLTAPAVKQFIAHIMQAGSEGCSDSYGATEFAGICEQGKLSPGVKVKIVPLDEEAPGPQTTDQPLNSAVVAAARLAGLDSVEALSSINFTLALLQQHAGVLETTTVDTEPGIYTGIGEILVRRTDGTQTRYWKRPAKQKKVWKDDWYHTDDIGSLNPPMRPVEATRGYMRPGRGVVVRGGIQDENMWMVKWDDTGLTSPYPADQLKFLKLQEPTLTIMGRKPEKQEIVIDEAAVWVDVGKLEQLVYGKAPGVRSVMLMGDRFREGIMAVVVPDDDFIRAYPALAKAAETSLPRGSVDTFKLVPPSAEAKMKAVLHTAAREAGVKAYEYPMAVLIEPRPWSETEEVVVPDMTGGGGERSVVGLVTLTGKPKRSVLQMVYRPALVALDKLTVR